MTKGNIQLRDLIRNLRVRQISLEEAAKKPCLVIGLPTDPVFGGINMQPAVLEVFTPWDEKWEEIPIEGKEDGGKD